VPAESPFTPGLPAPAEVFVGREHELNRLLNKIESAKSGKFQVAFIEGDRGIGKSSLASFVRLYAERRLDMAGAHVLLGGSHGLHDMVRRVFSAILKDSQEKNWFDRIKAIVGKNVRQVGLFGIDVTFDATADDLDALIRDFASALRNIARKLQEGPSPKHGLVLILDDINGLASSGEFADWFKSFVDTVGVSQQPLNVLVIVVGLEERRRSLIELQPSLDRVFDLFTMKPWDPPDAEKFFKETFESVAIETEPDALRFLVSYAAGYPAFAHEIGDATFRVLAGGSVVTREIALAGVVAAVEIIGRKMIAPRVIDAIRSEKYLDILEALVGEDRIGKLAFNTREVKEKLPEEQRRIFHNFITRMKSLGVILPEGNGSYRFASLLLFLYLHLNVAAHRQNRRRRLSQR
jgi:hypothetical protein